MKTHYLFFLAIGMAMLNQVFSQSYCVGNRYDKEVFTNFTKENSVQYGQNKNFYGSNQNLDMDIYQPTADTALARPLIIWVHGGSFISGSKTDGDVVSLCQKFSKRGYVTASINYRIYYFPLTNEVQAKKAVIRAVQDLKAAVRFFRKDAYTTNTYKIDTNNIFVGGVSAGALTSLHLAYLDTDSEFAAEIDTTGLGGLEGKSGNQGYLSTAKAVINLCGALGSASYLRADDEPFVSMHGTEDGTVPYATAPIPQVPSMILDGSYSINHYADSIGIINEMYTWFGADHVPFYPGKPNDAAYMDTTVRFVSNFLYKVLQCSPSDINPLPNTFTSTSENVTSYNDNIEVYPNPNNGKFRVSSKSNRNDCFQKIEIYNILGEVVFKMGNIKQSFLNIDLSAKESGIYFLKIYSANGQEVKKIIKD